YTDVIFNAAGQLSVLVTNILRLSKLENQSIQPISQTYDVCRQLSDCIIGYADQLESKQIDFTIETEDIAMVTADESMVEIIWNNLLSNAIKFTEPGGKITVTQTSDEKFVTVSVQDNGCGMNEETMRHIFDKFYQGDTSHLQQGNGLGLALVKKVVDLIGGEITVESKPGKGSIFQVNVCKFENK
ncbi:MAG: HAMP domain-containing histidine kinase, partial [Erysipelotrichia bacterium]|nr:HAMP domain-containing histidine kinase [Erysipelotrichia bacterium]